jgi:hypothetical protein
MTTYVVRTESARALMIRDLKDRALPFTVDAVKGAQRTNEQNRLQRLWCKEIAEQLGDQTPEEVRGFSKLAFGVPILRAENSRFCDLYDSMIAPLPYETRLAFMMLPFDMAVTRDMTTDQKVRYLDAMQNYWLKQGMVLTDPESRRQRAA